jgi:uncharacterized protein with HEPN domain
MAEPSLAPRLTDIIEAIEHIRSEMTGVSIDAFEADWRKRWLVERGVEIISEASRHLTEALKARHSEIPWSKVAGIGIAAPIMWKLAQDDLPLLERVCREGERANRPKRQRIAAFLNNSVRRAPKNHQVMRRADPYSEATAASGVFALRFCASTGGASGSAVSGDSASSATGAVRAGVS